MAAPAMSIAVRELTPENWSAWDRFVSEHMEGSPFHLTAWMKSIQETFGYTPMYQVAMDGFEIQGVLPLFLAKTLVSGKILVSVPFAVYGGILASSSPAAAALYERAKDLGREIGAGHIELRNAYPQQCLGTSNVSQYVTFTQEAEADEEKLLASLPKK